MQPIGHTQNAPRWTGTMSWSSEAQAYFDSIPDVPILSKSEAAALSYEMADAITGFRRAMEGIPGTALRLTEIWTEKVERDLVTGLLCEQGREDRGTDWSAHVDGVMARIRPVLEERSARRNAQLARLVRRADIRLAVLEEIHLELQAFAADETSAGETLRRRHDLDTAAGRRRLGKAAACIERRNRARQQFACSNLRMVISRAKRMCGMGVRFNDLIQEGNIGLLRAIDKFDPDRGFRFSTYAYWWIDQALIRAIQNQSRTVRVPSNVYERVRELGRVEERLSAHRGEPAERAVVAKELGIELGELEGLAATRVPIRSIDQPSRNADGRLMIDQLADESPERPEEVLHRKRVKDVVSRSMGCLRGKQRRVIQLRYGLRGGHAMTLREIGRELGLSAERVRQIESAALERLAKRRDVACFAPDEN